MASWLPVLPRRHRRRLRMRPAKPNVKHEAGATCPRCGDLNAWHALRCQSCGRKLTE